MSGVGSRWCRPVETSDGEFAATYTERGLAQINFPGGGAAFTAISSLPAEVREWHEMTGRALVSAMAGEAFDGLPPLDLRAGTDFQREVWQAMRKISLGQTQSYGALAATVGRPGGARAVGGACGANPIPVLIPCHRVLAAGKKLGGFSSGLDWKIRLLARERILL